MTFIRGIIATFILVVILAVGINANAALRGGKTLIEGGAKVLNAAAKQSTNAAKPAVRNQVANAARPAVRNQVANAAKPAVKNMATEGSGLKEAFRTGDGLITKLPVGTGTSSIVRQLGNAGKQASKISDMLPKKSVFQAQKIEQAAQKMRSAEGRRLPKGLQGPKGRHQVKQTMNTLEAQMAKIENRPLNPQQVDQIANALTENFKTMADGVFDKSLSKFAPKLPINSMGALKKFVGAFFVLELMKDLLFGGVGEVVGVAKIVSVVTEDIRVIVDKDRYRKILIEYMSPFDQPDLEESWVEGHYAYEDEEEEEEEDSETLDRLKATKITEDDIAAIRSRIIKNIQKEIEKSCKIIEESMLQG